MDSNAAQIRVQIASNKCRSSEMCIILFQLFIYEQQQQQQNIPMCRVNFELFHPKCILLKYSRQWRATLELSKKCGCIVHVKFLYTIG